MDIAQVKIYAVEILVFTVSFIMNSISPYLFLTVWCSLVVLSKFLLSKEERSASNMARAILIGVPVGVLIGSAVQENGYGERTSAAIGCAVSILSEKILNGDLPQKLIETLINRGKE